MDTQMSGLTLETAQAHLDKLLEAQASNMASVSIGGRSYSFRSSADLIEAINYWQRVIAGFQRKAAGQSRHGFSVANLGGPR
jgi:hypothetical protein